jgi:2'-5' RNA ligase
VRLFIAIFPPKEIINLFNDIQDKLKGFGKFLRFTKAEDIHITLRFLGNNVSNKSKDKILHIWDNLFIDTKKFNIRLQSINYGFENERWPRILYISAFRNEYLDKMIKKLNEEFCKLGLDDIMVEKNYLSFTYHFTIARSRKNLTKQIVYDIKKEIKRYNLWEGFHVDNVFLVKSILTKEGPKFSILRKSELKD